jgi:hypothetical protein
MEISEGQKTPRSFLIPDFPGFLAPSDLPIKTYFPNRETNLFPFPFPEVSSFRPIDAKQETSRGKNQGRPGAPLPAK